MSDVAKKFMAKYQKNESLLSYCSELLDLSKSELTTAIASYSTNLAGEYDSQKSEKMMLKTMQLEARLEEIIDEAIAHKLKMTVVLTRIEDEREVELLVRRYVLGEEIEDIAEAMGFKEAKSLYKALNKAIASVSEVLKDLAA